MAVGLSLSGWGHRDASFRFLNNKVTPSHGRFSRSSPGPVKQSWGEEWLQKVRLGSGGSWYRTCLPRSCKSPQKHGWWELKCEAVTPVTLPRSHCPRAGGQGKESWPWAPSLAVLSPRPRQLTGEWQLRRKELKDKGEEIGSELPSVQGLTSWQAWRLLPVGGPLASKGFMRVGQGKEDTEQKDWRNGALEEGTFSLVIQLKTEASFSTFTLGISLLFLLIITMEDFSSADKIRYTTKKKQEPSYCSILSWHRMIVKEISQTARASEFQ